MPAVRADTSPFSESSTARQLAGATPSLRAAVRYTSGAGLPLASSMAEQRTSMPPRPSRSQTASIRRRGDEDAIASRSPHRSKSAIAAVTPGMGWPSALTCAMT